MNVFWWLLLAFLWFLGVVILIYAMVRDMTDDHCEPGSKDCDNCPFPRCEKRNNSKGEK